MARMPPAGRRVLPFPRRRRVRPRRPWRLVLAGVGVATGIAGVWRIAAPAVALPLTVALGAIVLTGWWAWWMVLGLWQSPPPSRESILSLGGTRRSTRLRTHRGVARQKAVVRQTGSRPPSKPGLPDGRRPLRP
jgi:hypothetical protein